MHLTYPNEFEIKDTTGTPNSMLLAVIFIQLVKTIKNTLRQTN